MKQSNPQLAENGEVMRSLSRFPHVELANLPTPLQELKRLSEALGGPRIFMKRDDLTGLGGGGNKVRKLEYLVGDALAKGADCLITTGAVQSNHCRQTAAAAARCGLECHLVFSAAPETASLCGNYFLDHLFGAKFYWTEKLLRNEKMESVAGELRAQGKKPYVMPLGGSNPVGALGYVQAMSEIKAQVTALNLQIDHIFFATSSGGTQAGFVLGSKLCAFNSKLVGVSIDQVPDENSNVKFKQSVFDIIQTMADSMDLQNEVQLSDIIIEYGYLGAGYGVVGKVEKDAVRLMASTEGILVGPVYTGRALGALIDYVREGKIAANQNVLFIHTGDDIALHAYVHDFVLS